VKCGEVGRQAHFDAEPLAGLLHAVAVPLEHRVQLDPVPGGHGRREDPLDVDGTVPGGLLGVVDGDLSEVVCGLERGP